MSWISLMVVVLAILKHQLDHPQPIETSLRDVQHILRYPRGAAEFHHHFIINHQFYHQSERETGDCFV